MSRHSWDRVQALFLEALEQPEDSRDRFLEDLRSEHPDLSTQVRELLAGHAGEGAFDRLFSELTPPEPETVLSPVPPAAIGVYRIVREIGRGGMGTVFSAERADGQFVQRVALKLLRQDFQDETLYRRFLAERQILAHLDHPNIARLLDGGVTENGRPYFVMELVEGIPIDVFCDQHRLTLPQRLRLFRTVCDVVHYAHRHLVVHRDLKPGNILVSGTGPDGAVVKLLDFGIAKLLDSTAFPQPMAVTATGSWLMTPDWASPEQVRGGPVTTASDVYQLGLLLYGLLTGHRPYRITGRSYQDIHNAVCETVIEPPSAAVSRVESIVDGEGGPSEITPDSVSRQRGTTPERLRRRLRGDLDNIALLALRKEPERRYRSVEQLGEDIRRFLARLPVSARRDTFWYRTSRFFRRHRLGAAAGLAFVSLVLTFGVFMGLQAKRISVERDKAEHVASFLVELFEVADPDEARGNTITAREILDRGSARMRTELRDQPAVRADMMDVIGRVYLNLSLFDEAQPLLEEAFALRRSSLGPTHPDVAASLHSLGQLHQGRGELDLAEPLYQEALEIRRQRFGDRSLEVAESLDALGVLMQAQDDLGAAEPLIREALSLRRRLLGDVHADVADSLNNLALVLHRKGDYQQAERMYREALETARSVHGELHPQLAVTMTNLGWLLRTRGDLESAESVLREALSMRRALYGEQHEHVARGLGALADLLVERGRLEEAQALTQEALAIRRHLFGDESPKLADPLHALGMILQKGGDPEGAEALFRQSIALGDRGDSPRALNSLATLLEEKGDYVGAESLYRESAAIYREQLGDEHPFVAIVRGNIGNALRKQGAYDEAASQYRVALKIVEDAWGEEHPSAVSLLVRWGDLLMETARPAEAEPLLREALARIQRAHPEATGDIAAVERALGRCLTALERFPEAEFLLAGAHHTLGNPEPGSDGASRQVVEELIDLYESWGKDEESKRFRDLLSQTPVEGPPAR